VSLFTKRSDFESLEAEKANSKHPNITLPNFLTLSRAVGGTAVGLAMGFNAIDAKSAFAYTAILAATDAEGTLINLGKKIPPKLRDFMRIWPSKWGTRWDPAADKALGVSALVGGIAGGLLPPATGLILGTELATVGATIYAKAKTGKDPEVTKEGKAGLIARFTAIPTLLGAQAVPNEIVSDSLMYTGYASTIAAVALGAVSCGQIIKSVRNESQEPQDWSTGLEIIQAQHTEFNPISSN